ncbi:MAG: SRPBCC family protein [Gemmatimonadales bacterium]
MSAGNLTITALGDQEIVIRRTFAAPRELVFDAFTVPALVAQWLYGPSDWTFPVCEIDLRVGGRYRYVWEKPKTGERMEMTGVYQEITPPERIVATETFDNDWTQGGATSTLVLTERDGVTTMINTMRYSSREARDGVLRSPMESGLSAGYDRLDAALAKRSAAS